MPLKPIHEGRLAILAVDPGGTTGVAACYLPRQETLKESLRSAQSKKAIEVKGRWDDQAAQIATIMHNFVFTANSEHGIALDDIHIVFEDFILRRKRVGGATGNLTSVWVMAGAVTLFNSRLCVNVDNSCKWEADESFVQIHYQQASFAKGKATNERLKLWNLYETGSEHRRDAWRHICALADKLL